MDQNRFTSLIRDRQAEIKLTLSQSDTGSQAVELDQTKVGRLSRMDAIQQQQMSLESQRRLSRELVALDSALKRIDDGEYGLCVQCDEEIDPRRLEIDLVATLCIDCANKIESR